MLDRTNVPRRQEVHLGLQLGPLYHELHGHCEPRICQPEKKNSLVALRLKTVGLPLFLLSSVILEAYIVTTVTPDPSNGGHNSPKMSLEHRIGLPFLLERTQLRVLHFFLSGRSSSRISRVRSVQLFVYDPSKKRLLAVLAARKWQFKAKCR